MRACIFLLCVVFSLLLCADSGILYERGEHVHLRKGCITVGRMPRVVFNDDFSDANWRICHNRYDGLSLFHGERNGRRGLIVAKHPDAPADTAFELRSRVIPVEPGVDFTLEMLATGNWEMQSARGAVFGKYEGYHSSDDDSHGFFGAVPLPSQYKEDFDPRHSPHACRMTLRWLDRHGAEISSQPLAVDRLPEALVRVTAKGIVPEKAAYGQILLGAESPDFSDGAFLMLLNATLSLENGRFYPSASFMSRPFPIPRHGSPVEFDASTPGRSSVSLQLSTTDNLESGEWTPFLGPGLDPRRAYIRSGEEIASPPENHRWMRYKVYLRSDGKKIPVLKSVKIDRLVHENWIGEDFTPPTIEMLNPARLENPLPTLSFKIRDETGVDWRTLEMQIDGVDVSASIKRDGNVLSFVPKSPLKSREDIFDRLESWSFQNRNALLNLIPLTGDGFRIMREGGEADTFFQLTSPSVQVFPLEQYVFSMSARSNFEATANGDAQVIMTFLNKEGNVLHEEKIGRILPASEWSNMRFAAVAPLKTEYLIVTIRWEAPDFFDGRFLEMKNISLHGRSGQLDANKVNMHLISIQVADLAGNVCLRSMQVQYCNPPIGGGTLDDKGDLKRRTPNAPANENLK